MPLQRGQGSVKSFILHPSPSHQPTYLFFLSEQFFVMIQSMEIRSLNALYLINIINPLVFVCEINTIHVLINFIHQAKSSSASFRTIMQNDSNEYDLNDIDFYINFIIDYQPYKKLIL